MRSCSPLSNCHKLLVFPAHNWNISCPLHPTPVQSDLNDYNLAPTTCGFLTPVIFQPSRAFQWAPQINPTLVILLSIPFPHYTCAWIFDSQARVEDGSSLRSVMTGFQRANRVSYESCLLYSPGKVLISILLCSLLGVLARLCSLVRFCFYRWACHKSTTTSVKFCKLCSPCDAQYLLRSHIISNMLGTLKKFYASVSLLTIVGYNNSQNSRNAASRNYINPYLFTLFHTSDKKMFPSAARVRFF